jgi:hypothetical protein
MAWDTDGAAWWAEVAALGPARHDGRKLLKAVREAGGIPWLARGVVGVELPDSGMDPELLKDVRAHGAELAAALDAEYDEGDTRPQRRPLKYVDPQVNERVHIFNKQCMTNSHVFAKETGKENKGVVRAIQAVKDDFPQCRRWFYPHRRRRDGRVMHYDMTIEGLALVVRERLENQPAIGFEKELWIARYRDSHREAEAGRVLWFVRDKLKFPTFLAADGYTIRVITPSCKIDDIPPTYRPLLAEYTPEIRTLLTRRNLIFNPRPAAAPGQMALDFTPAPAGGWDDLMRDVWGRQ